jgi:hypothetical protein
MNEQIVTETRIIWSNNRNIECHIEQTRKRTFSKKHSNLHENGSWPEVMDENCDWDNPAHVLNANWHCEFLVMRAEIFSYKNCNYLIILIRALGIFGVKKLIHVSVALITIVWSMMENIRIKIFYKQYPQN